MDAKMLTFRKGQAQMLEYVLMLVFVVAVILGLILFLSWWQVSQLKVEKTKVQQDRAISLLKMFMDSPFMAKENGVFDDGKLTALQITGPEACEKLQEIYGADWYAVVTAFDSNYDPVTHASTMCDQSNYPSCNRWEICSPQDVKAKLSLVMPVNIHRKVGYFMYATGVVLPRTDIGLLNVTVYV